MALPTTITDLKDSLVRARAIVQRTKDQNRAITSRFMSVTKVGVGAVGSGALRAFFGNRIPGIDVEADLVIGTALSLAGVAGAADDMSDDLALIGAGFAARPLSENAEKFFAGLGSSSK